MGLTQFLDELESDGRATLPGPEALSQDEVEAAAPTLWRWAQRDALDLPGQAPTYSPPVAGWAARLLYHACQAFAFRELEADEVAARLSRPCPEPPSSSAAWSADLTLRHLPAVGSHSRGLSPTGPLRQALSRMAIGWPLSGVGVGVDGAASPEALECVLGHLTLRRLYVDRVLLAGDRRRLEEPRVLSAARAALGAHTDLSPLLAELLAASPNESAL